MSGATPTPRPPLQKSLLRHGLQAYTTHPPTTALTPTTNIQLLQHLPTHPSPPPTATSELLDTYNKEHGGHRGLRATRCRAAPRRRAGCDAMAPCRRPKRHVHLQPARFARRTDDRGRGRRQAGKSWRDDAEGLSRRLRLQLWGRMPACPPCGSVKHCSTACQREHWPQHKPWCKRFARKWRHSEDAA